MEKIIQLAIEGGWRKGDPMQDRYFEMVGERAFLDPEFWKCLGVAVGWLDEDREGRRWAFWTDEALKIGYEQKENMEVVGESRDKNSWRITWPEIQSAYLYPKEYLRIEMNENWKKKWHRFIDHLAEGKDPESFFSNLI